MSQNYAAELRQELKQLMATRANSDPRLHRWLVNR